jgi:hypothetical protein
MFSKESDFIFTNVAVKFETLTFLAHNINCSIYMDETVNTHLQFITHSIDNFICTNENCPKCNFDSL